VHLKTAHRHSSKAGEGWVVWGGIQESTAEALTAAAVIHGRILFAMLSDPYILTRLLVLFGMFAVTAVLGWLLHTLNERLDHRVPRYRRKLEAMYESFHRFLATVRAAAVRGVRQ